MFAEAGSLSFELNQNKTSHVDDCKLLKGQMTGSSGYSCITAHITKHAEKLLHCSIIQQYGSQPVVRQYKI